jgi:hypothetical protein
MERTPVTRFALNQRRDMFAEWPLRRYHSFPLEPADAAAELAFAYYEQASDNFALSVTAFEQADLALNTALRFDPESAR